MSRCYPYPPPGYTLSRTSNEALIESIKLQKEKEQREKDRAKELKKEKKREKKEKKKEKKEKRKQKDEELGPNQKLHKSDIVGQNQKLHKSDIAKSESDIVGQNQKLHKSDIAKSESDILGQNQKLHKSDNAKIEFPLKEKESQTAELLERSSLTEEHGQPLHVSAPTTSSDSTDTSNKRKRDSSSDNRPAKILRIKFAPKKQSDSNAPAANELRLAIPAQQKDSNVQRDGSGFSISSSKPERTTPVGPSMQARSGFVKDGILPTPTDCVRQGRVGYPADAVAHVKNANPSRSAEVIKHVKAGIPSRAAEVNQVKSAIPARSAETVKQVKTVDPQPSEAAKQVRTTGLPPKHTEAAKHVKPLAPSGPAEAAKQVKQVKFLPPSRPDVAAMQAKPLARSRSVEAVNQVKPVAAFQPAEAIEQVKPVSRSRPVEAVNKIRTGPPPVPSPPVVTPMQIEGAKYDKLFGCWVPPPLQMSCPDEDLDWLFQSKRPDGASAKRQKIQNDGVSCANSYALQPRAQLLKEVDIYALPYTVPY